jgi:predicted nucleic acid-binding Zn ribbon protein
MDKLARDATNALKKRMSYGQYMAQKKPEIIIPTPPKDVEMRECLRCGKLFPLNKQGSGKKKYCSDECREKFYAERDSKTETRTKTNTRTRTKTKVEQKPEIHKTCPICGKDFIAKFRNHKYCRESCARFGKSERMKLVYQRRKERMAMQNGNDQML